MPNLDQQGTKVLNLTVLQRIDPSIEDILLTAAHVAFYEFNIDQNQWSRKDVEGSLFVVKRNTEPWFQFIVMNRRNTENLVENLLGDFEYEVQVPYLLYKNASQEVSGIWFYNSRECEEVANLFNRIIDSITRIPSKPLVSSKSEFKELEPAPSMAVMEGPLEPSPVSSHITDVTESTSLSNFFNAATNLGNSVPNLGKPLQSYHPNNVVTSYVPSHQVQSTAASAPSIPLVRHTDVSDPMNRRHQITDLVKPSTFFTPHSSSAISMPPVSSSVPTIAPQPALNLQRPYGAPLLQPFPPPAPSSSLTPYNAATPTYGPTIDRDKVREALLMLVQDNQFIDMVTKALQQVHHM